VRGRRRGTVQLLAPKGLQNFWLAGCFAFSTVAQTVRGRQEMEDRPEAADWRPEPKRHLAEGNVIPAQAGKRKKAKNCSPAALGCQNNRLPTTGYRQLPFQPQRNGNRPSPARSRDRGVCRFTDISGEVVLRGTEGVIGTLGQRTKPVPAGTTKPPGVSPFVHACGVSLSLGRGKWGVSALSSGPVRNLTLSFYLPSCRIALQ
jgi:hypothetical protein